MNVSIFCINDCELSDRSDKLTHYLYITPPFWDLITNVYFSGHNITIDIRWDTVIAHNGDEPPKDYTLFWIPRWLTDFFCLSFMLKRLLIHLHINDKWERKYVLQIYLALIMFCRHVLCHFTCAIVMIYIICEFKSTAKLGWLSL